MLFRVYISIYVFFALMTSLHADEFNIGAQSATALNQVVMYPDSSFFKHSNIRYDEGALFEIEGISDLEHEDADQNQKFKWYKVKSRKDGKTGWIYGDGLAVHSDLQDLNPELKAFHQKKISLNNGFERSLLWVASINGRDNLHQKDYMNPIYNEYYLVLTNSLGRSVHLKCSGESAMGESSLRHIEMKDLTGDGVSEFILEKSVLSVGSDLEDRILEVYSLQAGTLVKIFEERMTLTYENNMAAPSLFKNIQVEEDLIRVAYVDYVKCKRSNLEGIDKTVQSSLIRCLEYVTYTLVWDARQKKFKPIYNKSISALFGQAKSAQIQLLSKPDKDSAPIAIVSNQEELWLKQHVEAYAKIGMEKKVFNYFKVETDSGQVGYLPADQIKVVDVEQASLLNAYYQKAPLYKNAWKTDNAFLVID